MRENIYQKKRNSMNKHFTKHSIRPQRRRISAHGRMRVMPSGDLILSYKLAFIDT